MAKRKHIRVKMRNSLHGQPIAIPRNVDKHEAAAILRRELQADTPVDKGKAVAGWHVRELANGDMRVVNEVRYIRRLMIDGTSPQESPGAYNRSIKQARSKILQKGLEDG